jgi:CubicO group peptidase (beta-lactamase class C family)
MNNRLIIPFLFFLFLQLSLPAQQSSHPLHGLDDYIAQAVEDFELPGLAIAIIKDDSVVMMKGYGVKNTDTNEPMTSSALFNIASCSKAFTAACLAHLVEQGKLSWKDKVIDWVPEFQLADPYITSHMNILDLLSHRSGISTFTGDLLWFGTDYSQEEVLKRMRHLPIENEFRSEYGYQNNMYTVAGMVIERVSGKSWEAYLQEHFFDPLEMNNSRSCSNQLPKSAELAMPHIKGQVTPIDPFDPQPALSIYSSVEELSAWVRMLLNKGSYQGEEVLSKKSLNDLWTARIARPVSDWQRARGINLRSYGLGWNLYDYSGRLVVEHDGGMPGYISKVCLVPQENLGLVILTNDMSSLGSALRYRILDRYLNDRDHDWAKEFLGYKKQGEAYEQRQKEARHAKRQEGTSPSLDLEAYAGTYRDRYYGDAEVKLMDGQLHFTMLPTQRYFAAPLNHWHHDTWQFDFPELFLPEGFLTFSFTTDGEVEGFKVDLPNPDFHFYKLDFKKVE